MSLNMNKLLFVIILIAVFTAGAFLSYLWIVGYYVSLELKIPDEPVICVHDFVISAKDPTFFNITILNPSFSPKEAKILGIEVLTRDKNVHYITFVTPQIPEEGYTLNPGDLETFRCSWNWAKYTGQTVNIIVLVKEGSGVSFQTTLPLTKINIVNIEFDPEFGNRFNMTVTNSNLSATNVTLIQINVMVDNSVHGVDTQPTLPINLEPGDSINLTCTWDWANHQSEDVTLVISTIQGYFTKEKYTVPTYAIFTIQNVEFNLTNTSHFNLTIANSENSMIALKITDISITLKNGTSIKPEKIMPSLPCIIDRNSTISFICEWNWTAYRGERITITVSTKQGYKTKTTWKIP